jgi:hypothetical protein
MLIDAILNSKLGAKYRLIFALASHYPTRILNRLVKNEVVANTR